MQSSREFISHNVLACFILDFNDLQPDDELFAQIFYLNDTFIISGNENVLCSMFVVPQNITKNIWVFYYILQKVG